MRLRIRFSKLGKVRFTSHRDVARIWERAVRRAGVAVKYSEGFSPRPRLSFGLALSTGAESLAEYVDIELADELDGGDPSAVAEQLDAALPVGFAVMAAEAVGPEAGSLQQVVTSCGWEIDLHGADLPTTRAAVERLLAAETVVVKRERKGKPVEDDLRPGVLALHVADEPHGTTDAADAAVVRLVGQRIADEELEQVGGVGRGVDPPELRHVAPAVGLVEQVLDPGIQQRMHAGAVEEVLLDVPVREQRQGEGRVRATHDGAVLVDPGVAVEAQAQVRHEAVDGVAQVVALEEVVLHDPAGQHAVADLVAQPRIVLAQQVEQGGQQLGGGSSRRDLGIGIDDGFPQGTIRDETHASSVWHPRSGPNSSCPARLRLAGSTNSASGTPAPYLAGCGGVPS